MRAPREHVCFSLSKRTRIHIIAVLYTRHGCSRSRHSRVTDSAHLALHPNVPNLKSFEGAHINLRSKLSDPMPSGRGHVISSESLHQRSTLKYLRRGLTPTNTLSRKHIFVGY